MTRRSRLGDNVLRMSAEGMQNTREALNLAAEDLASIAKTETAPIRYGHLRRGIHAVAAENFEQAVGGSVIFADVVAPEDYAYIQHEGDFNHPKGGQQYYLTDPLERRGPTKYMPLIERAAGRAIVDAGTRAFEEVIE